MTCAWDRGTALAVAAAGAAYAAVVAAGLAHRHWDPDEFQHAQFAWLVAQGQVPFRDFFEHHPPLWHLLAAPFAGGVDASRAESVFGFLVGARAASLLLSGVLALLAWMLARRFAPPPVPGLAVALLLGAGFVITKGVEVRPDPLCAVLLACSGLALAKAAGGVRAGWWCFAAGLAFGAAAMASLKAAMAGPGLALGFLLLAAPRLGVAPAVGAAVAAVPGAVLALLPVGFWFAAHGALPAFGQHVLLIHLDWPRDGGGALLNHLRLMAERDVVLVLLGLAGLGCVRGEAARFLLPVLVSLAIGGFALPVAQEQYILLALPFGAIWAAIAAGALVARLPSLRLRRWAFAVLAVLLAATTARNLHAGYARTDTATRALVAALLAQVPPDGTILAGWTPGFGFRKPAWRHFFLHEEVQRVVPARDFAALDEGLRSGRIRPIAADADVLHRLPPAIAALLDAQMEPTETPRLLRRRP